MQTFGLRDMVWPAVPQLLVTAPSLCEELHTVFIGWFF